MRKLPIYYSFISGVFATMAATFWVLKATLEGIPFFQELSISNMFLQMVLATICMLLAIVAQKKPEVAPSYPDEDCDQ